MPACKKPECHDTKTDAVCDTCLLDLKEEREAWDYMNGIMKERKEQKYDTYEFGCAQMFYKAEDVDYHSVMEDTILKKKLPSFEHYNEKTH